MAQCEAVRRDVIEIIATEPLTTPTNAASRRLSQIIFYWHLCMVRTLVCCFSESETNSIKNIKIHFAAIVYQLKSSVYVPLRACEARCSCTYAINCNIDTRLIHIYFEGIIKRRTTLLSQTSTNTRRGLIYWFYFYGIPT